MTLNSSLLASLRGKRDGIAGHSERRPVLFILSGALHGYCGGASLMTLQQMGFTSNVFSAVAGISAGALSAALYMSCSLREIMELAITYHERNRKVINWRRLRKIFDIDAVMAAVDSSIDVPGIMRSPTDLFIGLSTKDGEPRFVNAKIAQPNMLAAIHAGISIPGLYRRTVVVNGEQCRDQVFDLFPIQELIRAANPSDVLVIANRKKRDSWGISPMDIALAMLNLRSPKLALKALKRKTSLRGAQRFCEQEYGINIDFIWIPEEVELGPFTKDASRIRRAVQISAQATAEAFGESLDIRV